MRTPVVEPDAPRAERATAPVRLVPAWWRTVTLLLLAAMVLGGVAGVWTWRAAGSASEFSAEVGFSRDMVQHHQQAVTMSFLVRDRTDDPEVRALAMDMITAQSEEQGMLTAWLRRHDVPASSSVPQMGWMAGAPGVVGEHGAEHGDSGDPEAGGAMSMAGMGLATDEELTELARLQGPAAEVEFLRLMREHHTGGSTMIRAYLELGSDDELRRIAEGMLTAQTREIRLIDELLDARGDRA